MILDDDFFPVYSITLGVLVVVTAVFAPEGEGKTAAIALGSNLTGGGLVAYQAKLKYRGDDDLES